MLRVLILNAVFWVLFLGYLFTAIINRKISIEYSINWLLSILLIFLATSSVALLNKVAIFLGVAYPPALLIAVAFYLQIVLLLYFTMLLSKLSTEKKMLMQDYLVHSVSYPRNSDVLILLPAFNEARNIAKVINDTKAKYPYDILVINDGSTDLTEDILKSLPCFFISHSYNSGYGVALETGYKFARKQGYQQIIQFDADGQHDVDSIAALYNSMSESGDDVVIGSRFLAKDGHYNAGVARTLGMSLFRGIIRLILKKNYSDPTSGLQILNRDVIEFYSTNNRFPDKYPDANMIILLNLSGFKVSEIPVTMHPNTEGKSMHSGFFKPIIYMIYMTLSILILVVFRRSEFRMRAL